MGGTLVGMSTYLCIGGGGGSCGGGIMWGG